MHGFGTHEAAQASLFWATDIEHTSHNWHWDDQHTVGSDSPSQVWISIYLQYKASTLASLLDLKNGQRRSGRTLATDICRNRTYRTL